MRLHGHTKIELTDVSTGKVKKIEHENTFTSAIEKFLWAGGEANNSPFANADWAAADLWKNLIGGIFLFDKTIDGLPITMPAGTKMIANGSYGISNNSSVTEMGSWNSSESSYTSNSITMVYDWSTDQGNGTINSLALTSDIGGYIGYGNSTSNAYRSHTYFQRMNYRQSAKSNYSGYYNESINGNTVYYFTSNDRYLKVPSNKKITMYIKAAGITEASLFNKPTSRVITIPDNAVYSNYTEVYPLYGGKFLFVKDGIFNANTTLYFEIYDAVNDTWLEYSWTSTIPIITQKICPIGDGTKIFVSNYDSRSSISVSVTLYVLDLTTQTLTQILQTSGDARSFVQGGMQIDENLALLELNIQTSDPYVYIVDLINNTVRRTNTHYLDQTYGTYAKKIRSNYLSYSMNPSNAKVMRLPLYLATVNNLDEPVTKTNAQTMKVTYVVTKA